MGFSNVKLLIFVLVAFAGVMESKNAQYGEWTPADVTSHEILDIAQRAIDKNDNENSKPHPRTLDYIIEAYTKIVAGKNYKLKMVVFNQDTNEHGVLVKKDVEVCDLVVYKRFHSSNLMIIHLACQLLE